METRIDNIRLNTLMTNAYELDACRKDIKDNWNDTNFYDRSDNFTFEGRKTYHYENDEICFDFTFIVKGWEYWDCGHDGCEFTYELCLVPAFDSLNEDMQQNIREVGVDDLEPVDVSDYGCEIAMGKIRTLNDHPDIDMVALAASAIPDCMKRIDDIVEENIVRLSEWIN